MHTFLLFTTMIAILPSGRMNAVCGKVAQLEDCRWKEPFGTNFEACAHRVIRYV